MPDDIELTLPDRRSVRFPRGVPVADILEFLPDKEPVLGIAVNRRVYDRVARVWESGVVRPVRQGSEEALEILRHSTAHIMASAVKELFPSVKVTIGPAIEGGFYYDFDSDRAFTEEDLARIEEKMREIVRRNDPFVRTELSADEARALFQRQNEPYKVEILNDLVQQSAETVTTYTHGSFTDLCRGPHVAKAGDIPAFKLTHVAGAYWRGDERNKMLQRIYGTAFFDEQSLTEHLARLEEAKRRDHRKVGHDLDLFSISDTVGPGLVLWHPKGARIRHIIETFWKERHLESGYELVYTPHIAKIDMWHQSGHTGFYSENMYSPMDVAGHDYIAKPMNCPFHIEIYRHGLKSYRDLPIRWAELGTVYRYERSGVLHGLLRVRGFTQDDAHIFCRPDQLKEEVRSVLRFVFSILNAFGFREFKTYLSTRPEKFVGTEENWSTATEALRSVLVEEKVAFEVDPGEGVFYGPKIDIKMLDGLGRAWQCSTVQVDFNLPERFDLTYVAEDGGGVRPIMVHRALMGSLERFFACLVEFYGGAFPLWLSPVQAKILTVTDRAQALGEAFATRMREARLRVETDFRNEKLGFKIREAQLEKVPYMILLGDQEVEGNTASIRSRSGAQEKGIPIDQLIRRLVAENETRSLEPTQQENAH